MNLDDYKSFVDLVEKMRTKQCEYFNTRDYVVLHESKKLERQVDQFIEQQKNPGLF